MVVCPPQVAAKAVRLAVALSRPPIIVDVDAELLVKEVCEGLVGEVEYNAALHAEHPVDDRNVHGADPGIRRGDHGSPQSQR